MATSSESLEEILSQYGLKDADLDRECSQRVRDEVAVKFDDWEMTGRCLEFSLEKLRDIALCAIIMKRCMQSIFRGTRERERMEGQIIDVFTSD